MNIIFEITNNYAKYVINCKVLNKENLNLIIRNNIFVIFFLNIIFKI